jgi:hypothetical protein
MNVVFSFVVQYPARAFYNKITDGAEDGFKLLGEFKSMHEAAAACIDRANRILRMYALQGKPAPEILGIDHMRKYHVKKEMVS